MTTNEDFPETGAWRTLLSHPEIDRLLEAYIGENADQLVAGRPAPPLQDYLIASGMTNVPAGSVTYAGARTAAADAHHEQRGCRLVCRSAQGGTDCFWVCRD
jgi:hypothetical protein